MTAQFKWLEDHEAAHIVGENGTVFAVPKELAAKIIKALPAEKLRYSFEAHGGVHRGNVSNKE